MRTGSSRTLRILLGIFAAASMLYFLAGVANVYQTLFHPDRLVHDPFQMDYATMAVTKVDQEARQAGLAKGDVIESLDGHRYSGQAQMQDMEQTAHPGEAMQLGVREKTGAHKVVTIRLTRATSIVWTAGRVIIVVGLEVVCTLICLLLGYWVAFARPRDPNAWLILLLLSCTEVIYGGPNWTGHFQDFLEFWYQTGQVAAPVVVLLVGIYFPERWRLDRKLPWLKWLLIVPEVLTLALALTAKYWEYYHPEHGAAIKQVAPWVDRIANPISLCCVLVYLAAIVDKLRSATTADNRRRMRVLCAGSVVGLGALLLIFVAPRAMGIEVPKAVQPWLFGIGVFLLLLFPFSLAYVVVVQRALDVRILLRMGTKYVLARATLLILQLAVGAFVIWRLIEPLMMKKTLRLHDLIVPLAVAAVFFALVHFGFGKRLQQWIDRRFFREAYTAEVVLHDLSEQARTLTESGSLVSTVSRRISEVLHVPQIGVLLRGGQSFRLQEAFGMDLALPVILSERSQAVQNLQRENRPATLYREDPDSWFSRADAEEQRALNAVNAEILLPLPGREKLMGLMTLGPKLSEEPYSPSDLRMLQSVATQTGLALEVSELAHSLAREAAQRERINREIEIAREVQERLFPQTVPQVAGISLAGFCRPALAVGGDYYDFIELEDGRIGLAMGDVSGKGVSAALLMASLRASLRGMTIDGSHNLSRLMGNVNRLVYEASTINRYATFFFSIFNPATFELKYVNAGHNPPVVLKKGAAVRRLDAGGPVIGLLKDLPYEEQSVILAAGDLLVAYTDGISEAMTVDDEEWGEERMIAAAEAVRSEPVNEIVRALFNAADQFTRGAEQHDDMTLLVMKIEGVLPG